MSNPFEHLPTGGGRERQSNESLISLAEDAGRSFFYSLVESPYNAVAQTVNHVRGKTELKLVEPPRQAEAYSARWAAQQLGGGLGAAMPFLAVGALERGAVVRGLLAESTAASLCRQMTIGAVYGGLFTPVDDRLDFLQEKGKSALSGALSFAAMASIGKGLSVVAEGARPPAAGMMSNSYVRSALSGLAGGAVTADIDSLVHTGQAASNERRLESALSFAMVNSAMTGGAHLADRYTPLKGDGLSGADVSFVCDLTRRAGRLASEMRHGVEYRTKSNPNDFVTEADLKLSDMITGELKERFPKDVVISEESDPPPGYDTQGRIWLVDPIDSTYNYVKGKPGYSVMVGLMNEGKPTFGWVNDPEAGVTFFGGKARGAWQQQGSDSPQKFGAVTAFGGDAPLRLMMASHDRAANPHYEKLTDVDFVRQGSVGLKVGRILRNEADLLVSTGAVGKYKVWDTAGPAAIAEAGGLETREFGGGQLQFPLPALEHGRPVAMGRPGAADHLDSQLHELSDKPSP